MRKNYKENLIIIWKILILPSWDAYLYCRNAIKYVGAEVMLMV